MLTLLIGKKGSGKTKRLIECANKALETSKGNVLVLEKGKKLTHDISHKARLIDMEDYKIKGKETMYGFVSGLCASNYDVTDILIDSTLKIIGDDMELLECLVRKLNDLAVSEKTNIVLSVSAAEEDLPESVKEYMPK